VPKEGSDDDSVIAVSSVHYAVDIHRPFDRAKSSEHVDEETVRKLAIDDELPNAEASKMRLKQRSVIPMEHRVVNDRCVLYPVEDESTTDRAWNRDIAMTRAVDGEEEAVLFRLLLASDVVGFQLSRVLGIDITTRCRVTSVGERRRTLEPSS